MTYFELKDVVKLRFNQIENVLSRIFFQITERR